ncbi:MAG TPA: TIGR01777 family oxidoreductase [Candidatus Dormibacteraeota bacterium]|nr:TIGR01777 family oxidoreductase [Candidatus Dormibacteraeota bacterium]
MKILVTGASGLVGSALVPMLVDAGHTVCRLVRPGQREEQGAAGFAVTWDPSTGELGGAAVGPDAVINLAGAPIAEQRWTAARKEVLRSSRVNTTRAMVAALAKMNARPRVLISASATGIYGDRGDELLTEESQPGENFLAELARDWEAEALKAEAMGIRVVRARFGIILARNGGALPKMMLPFRFGLGGKLGTGEQWMSWITLQDVTSMLRFALENTAVTGAVNVVSPQPMRNAEFTKALGSAMRRPAALSAPAFALRLALGEMADTMLLASQRAVPAAMQKIGFHFQHTDIASALNAVLNEK